MVKGFHGFMVKWFQGLRGWFVALKDNFKIDNRSCKLFNRETMKPL